MTRQSALQRLLKIESWKSDTTKIVSNSGESESPSSSTMSVLMQGTLISLMYGDEGESIIQATYLHQCQNSTDFYFGPLEKCMIQISTKTDSQDL